MTTGGRVVLRPGERVCFDVAEHQVVALAGTSVRLRSHSGSESVVLVSLVDVLAHAVRRYG